jgi:hypothetical protein
VLAALREAGPLLAERLLGALELTVPGLDLTGTTDVSPYLDADPAGQRPRRLVGIVQMGQQSEAITAAAQLDVLRPGIASVTASLTRQLARHPLITPLLAVPPEAADEASVAARHGAAHLALAVSAASVVVGQRRQAPASRPAPAADPARVASPTAAIVGIALGSAALLLRDIPMPAAYAAALLEKTRAEYRLPHSTSGAVQVAGHRFGLVEGVMPDTADFSGNGLVALVPGGAMIRTGIADGSLRIMLRVYSQAPPLRMDGWDEVVEVSWHATEGQASVAGPDAAADPRLRRATPPWPGDYRLRVHASGRDEADEEEPGEGERYELAIWQAPPGPETVHKRADRLGHRLRGEPESPRRPAPERAYAWIGRSELALAATITMVTGASVDDVLRAFAMDPARPGSRRAIAAEITEEMSNEPWVTVLADETAVLVVEYNGYQGTDRSVLATASAAGRAASMFWNVNGVTRLSFAEGGRLLASFEPFGGNEVAEAASTGPSVAAALADLDFGDSRGKQGKGLVAVERFTGRGITREDLDRVEEADVAYRASPDS